MNERDYELLSRSLDGLLGPNESATFAQRLLDDPELGATKSLWEEIDMAAREVYPKTVYKRPDPPKTQSPRWLRVAAAAIIAVALGGLTWAAIEYFTADDTAPVQDNGTPTSEPVEPRVDTGTLNQSERSDPTNQSFGVPSPPLPEPADLLHGTIVDVAGSPVSDATVTAFEHQDLPTRDGGVLAVASSESDGTFEFPKSPRMDSLVIRKPGYRMSVLALQDAIIDRIRVCLLRESPVTAYIATLGEDPIADARLFSEESLTFAGVVESIVTRSDGSFEAPLDISHGSGALIGVHGDDARFALDSLAPGIILIPVLRPGASIRVRVIQDDRPVEGALVSIEPASSSPPLRSDSDGYATLTNLSTVNGSREVTLFASDTYGNTASLTLDQTGLEPGKMTYQLIVLPTKGSSSLRGTVAGPDGRGIPDAMIIASREPGEQVGTFTDTNGHYELPLPAGHYDILVRIQPACGFTIDSNSPVSVDVPASGPVFQDFTARAVAPTVLHVRDAQGRPIEHAELGLLRDGWLSVALLELPGGQLRTRDPRRPFCLLDPETGMAGCWAGEREEADSILVLDTPTINVRGTAVDAAGRPLPGLVIYAFVQPRNVRAGESWPSFVAQSGPDGRFVLQHVPKLDDASLEFRVPGYQPLDYRRNRDVRLGKDVEPVRLVLGPANARVSGMLLYADRTPAEFFSVRADAGSESWAYAQSEPDGYFQLYVAAGDYQLKAAESGALTTASMNITAPVSNIEWVLPVPSPRQLENVAEPSGSGHDGATAVLAALSELFTSFAADSQGSRYPALVRQYGTFMPDFAEVRNITGLTGDELNRLLGSYDGEVCYLGHLVPDEPTAMAFLDAYETYGPEGVAGQDINTSEEAQQEGLPRVFQLREGIERFLITDINDPNAGGKAQSKIPVIWELPGNHEESGGWVVYMDGHTEWLPYPGPFPMSEAFVTRVREIGGVTE